MTIAFRVIEPFIDWLNPPAPGRASYKKRGLREDAPEEAKKAFERYLEILRDAEARGRK